MLKAFFTLLFRALMLAKSYIFLYFAISFGDFITSCGLQKCGRIQKVAQYQSAKHRLKEHLRYQLVNLA